MEQKLDKEKKNIMAKFEKERKAIHDKTQITDEEKNQLLNELKTREDEQSKQKSKQ